MAPLFSIRPVRLAAFALVLGGLFGGAYLVSAKAENEPTKKSKNEPNSDAKTKFVQVASLGDGGGAATGVGGLLCDTGYTCLAIEPVKAGTTRIIVSAAYGGATKPAPNLRVVAKDRQGKMQISKTRSAVSGAGAKFGVVTMDCEFDLAPDSIAELVVEQAMP